MPNELLTVGDAARRIGVAVTTLRTWHQRYGLGPSHHRAGRHRRYTPDDLARLDIMRRLTAQGVPAASAARVVLGGPPPSEDIRDGGGHAIPLGRAVTEARGLARSAVRLDHAAMRDSLGRAVQTYGVLSTWDSLVRPVLHGVGERYARTHRMIEIEHLLSRCVSEVLATVPRPSGPATVLLACADEEQHTLPLEALSAALAELGVPSRLLGARVPLEALLAAVRRTGPGIVVLWSHAASTADPALLTELLNHRPAPAVVAAAGPGWHAAGLPAAVHTPGSLSDAIDLVIPGALHPFGGADAE
ncbi:MerR family transcriptional regulator [Amycolatopsis pigmentata]|uniref:MerR family transcriptional regulator n=1 Tax=Amycolatopsis pigmentata TaxID=450801 RepID=A0ABW5G0D7_9PSEU